MISQMEVTLTYKFATLSHQLMLNIASVNMPKIKPETKVLIIKNLKSKSLLQTSSMCLNGRWRGFASATKRLAMSMTDPSRADRARQLRSGRQRRLFRQELYVGFSLTMVSTVVLLPKH